MWFLQCECEHTASSNDDDADDDQIGNAPQFIDAHVTMPVFRCAQLVLAPFALLPHGAAAALDKTAQLSHAFH